MRRSAYETALLIVVIVVRSGQNRARISAKTVRILSGRRNLQASFMTAVATETLDLGYAFFSIAVGGFGCIQVQALETAKAVTAKARLTAQERNDLSGGKLDFDGLEKEILEPDSEDSGDDQDD